MKSDINEPGSSKAGMSTEDDTPPKKKAKTKIKFTKKLKEKEKEIVKATTSEIAKLPKKRSPNSAETEAAKTILQDQNVEDSELTSRDNLQQEMRTHSKSEDYNRNDLVDIVLDEVSLEGLDGITIEALWTRISIRISDNLPFSSEFQNIIWEILMMSDKIKFYLLPEPRPKFVLFNRFKYVDWDTGHLMEPGEVMEDIYKYSPVSEQDSGGVCLGSCADYKSRVNISDEIRHMTLPKAEDKYGMSLVIVADQILRNKALGLEESKSLDQLSNVHYCVLEKIGRSRRLGEVTVGKNSLMQLSDSKTLFYLRKILLANGLITKQSLCIRFYKTGNTSALLFHLRRFYNEYKSVKTLLIEQIIDILKKKPNNRIEYVELRKILGQEVWHKGVQKLIKSPEFKQLVRTDLLVPYRAMYPNASQKEWKVKHGPKEKNLRILQLINPRITLSTISKEDETKDESSDDEAIGEFALNFTIFRQVYKMISESGSEGLTLKQVEHKLGLDFYIIRSVLTNMLKKNMLETKYVDAGRLHILKYYVNTSNEENATSKTASKEIPTTSTAEAEAEDEALSFIADVLEVDKNELVSKPRDNNEAEIDTDDEPDNPFKGQFDYIRNYRTKNRIERYNRKNKAKLQDEGEISDSEKKQKAEEREKFEAIFKNDHPYYPMELSLEHKRIKFLNSNEKVDDEFMEMFNTACSDQKLAIKHVQVDYDNLDKYEDITPNIRGLDKINSLPNPLKARILLGSCENSSGIIRRYLFLPTTSTFDVLLKKFHRIMKDIQNKSASKNLEFPDDLSSDDEVYINNEKKDNMSLDVNFEKEMKEYVFREDVEVTQFKTDLIQNFEKITCVFVKEYGKLPMVKSSQDETHKKRKLKVGEVKEAKKIKLATGAKEDVNVVEEQQDHIPKDTTALLKKITSSIKMEMYLSHDPVLLSHCLDEDNIETTIISTKTIDIVPTSEKYSNKSLTQRSVARANFILETVYRDKVISNLSKLISAIRTIEKGKKLLGIVDRKSVDRLLHYLVISGHIKVYKIILKYENVVRCKNIICQVSLDAAHTLQVFIDQLKIVFFIYAKKKTDIARPSISTLLAEANNPNTTEVDSYDEIVALTSSHRRPKYKHSRTIARQYGYVPKFAKIKIIHELLFYLIYSYDGQAMDPEEVPNLLKQFHVEIKAESVKELGIVYKKELSWKMFIPPLPKYKSWPSGWALICDIILRLPLSIFVKIFNIAYVIPELVPILNDPVKKHVLLKHIPADVRNACLHNRKCIFSIHEILCHLCYIGLLQFGVQKLKEKEQQFIYLNRRAILYDTTSSEPGYHEVTQKEYPVLQFYFDNQAIVDNYWSKTWNISLNTKLGQRNCLLQKTITLQDIHAKPEMVQSVIPKAPGAAVEADIGYIPGDRLGACCFDSSSWVHVKRNWIWSTAVRKPKKVETALSSATGLRRKHLDQVMVKPIKYKDLPRELSKKKLKKVSLQTESKVEIKTISRRSRKYPLTRKVLPRPTRSVRTLKYDDLDKKIMKKMGKSRAVWSENEDANVLICHLAKKFLTFNSNKKMISALIIRDVMHRLCPHKRKKTTLAYVRRCHKLVKADKVQGNERYSYHLENDKYLQKVFSKFRNRIADGEVIPDVHINIAFVYLVSYIANTYRRKLLNPHRVLEDDGHFDYLNAEDIPKYLKQDCRNTDIIYQNPESVDDIKVDVIKDIVHCSLGWKSESSELPLMLYRAYQHYPDALLREALSWLRKHQIIAGKKVGSKHGNIKEGIHMAGKLIHNSFVYSYKQITKYPDYIYPEAYQMFATIYKNHAREREFLPDKFEQGHGLGLSEIACFHDVVFTFKIPDDLLVLDPKITDHSQLIQELAARYKFLIHTKKTVQGDEQEKTTTTFDNTEGVEKAIEVIFESQKRKSTQTTRDLDISSSENEVVHLTEIGSSSGYSEPVEKNRKDEKIERASTSSAQIDPEADALDKNETTKKALQDLTSYLGNKQGDDPVKVSDLACLLTKGLFPELDGDEERLERLSRHFLITYPSPMFYMPNTLVGEPWAEELLSNGQRKGEEVQEMVKSECIVRNSPHDEEITNTLMDLGGDDEDINLAFAVVNYIKQQGVFGTSTSQLKKEFLTKTQNLDLHEIVAALIKIGIIFRTGVRNINLVHVSENEIWTVGLDDERPISELNLNSLGVRLKLMPWVRINGTLNLKVLHNWMYVILSYCLSHPLATMPALMKRFNVLKPVDVFSLLQYLQALDCLRIYTYTEAKPVTLLSTFDVSPKRPVNILDDFETIFVETDKAAIIKMGALRYKGQTDIDIPFEE